MTYGLSPGRHGPWDYGLNLKKKKLENQIKEMNLYRPVT